MCFHKRSSCVRCKGFPIFPYAWSWSARADAMLPQARKVPPHVFCKGMTVQNSPPSSLFDEWMFWSFQAWYGSSLHFHADLAGRHLREAPEGLLVFFIGWIRTQKSRKTNPWGCFTAKLARIQFDFGRRANFPYASDFFNRQNLSFLRYMP